MNFWFWFSLVGLICMMGNVVFDVFDSNISGILGWAAASLLQFSYIATHFLPHAVK